MSSDVDRSALGTLKYVKLAELNVPRDARCNNIAANSNELESGEASQQAIFLQVLKLGNSMVQT